MVGRIRNLLVGAALILSFAPATLADSARAIIPATSSTIAPVIVIGFVGGFVRHDAIAHSTVQLAERLRHDYPIAVHAEVLENRNREKAHAEIMRLMDIDHDGSLSTEEKKTARIVLYGHSWGASAAVTLARQLDREGIPVLLTVQVDSVPRRGQNDEVIPG